MEGRRREGKIPKVAGSEVQSGGNRKIRIPYTPSPPAPTEYSRLQLTQCFYVLAGRSSQEDLCPSLPVTYALVGDNVTLCWQIPTETNTTQLKRFTVLALKRPVQREMEKVASANKGGQYFRTYDKNHDGLYKDRVTVNADLQARMLFLRMANYTTDMENVYCVLYEMSVINDVPKCHSHAVFLRTAAGKFQSQFQFI